MKVSIFDKDILKQFSNICATITAILSAVLIFLDIPNQWRITSGVVYIVFLSVIYIFLWIRANRLRQIDIKIGITTVVIKSGDIFKEDGLKAIAFNEYFDTRVDDKIIAKKSLNGQFILNHIDDVDKLNSDIESDDDLKNSIIGKEVKRKQGKTTKYKLGSSILIDDEYILTAFSRFNKNNQAELTIQEYVNFLLTFWNEINRLYAQRSVTVPVFGAGITRFKNGFEDIDINELLRIMIWTFKISKIKFAYPAKLTIIVHDDLLSQVNLYELKENE
ncbi:macro domain-containing protein [Streptococcus dentasini]